MLARHTGRPTHDEAARAPERREERGVRHPRGGEPGDPQIEAVLDGVELVALEAAMAGADVHVILVAHRQFKTADWSKASGEIMNLLVESGDAVRRGDLLGEVDPRDVRNTYAQAEADLEVAKARMTTATAQKRRSEELLKANVITEQEYESATFELTPGTTAVVGRNGQGKTNFVEALAYLFLDANGFIAGVVDEPPDIAPEFVEVVHLLL